MTNADLIAELQKLPPDAIPYVTTAIPADEMQQYADAGALGAISRSEQVSCVKVWPVPKQCDDDGVELPGQVDKFSVTLWGQAAHEEFEKVGVR